MRKWNGFLACTALALALVAGCGGDDKPRTTATPEAGAGTTSPTAPVEPQVTDGRTGDAVTADSRSRRERTVGRGTRITGKAKRKGRRGEVSVGAGAACPDGELMPTDANLGQIEAAVLCLINGERSDHGLGAVAPNAQLAQAALAHSRDMVDNNFFAHVGSGGSTLVSRVEPTGYLPTASEWVLGENLAFGTGALSTPRAVVQGWMDSPGHRENLLSPEYQHVGIGVLAGVPVAGRTGGATYTTDYGARGTSGSGAGSESAPATRTRTAGRAGITTSARRRCARKGRVAKKVRGKVRCVRKKRSRR